MAPVRSDLFTALGCQRSGVGARVPKRMETGATGLQSARSLTVKMTVNALRVKQKARVYAALRLSEMIEWE